MCFPRKRVYAVSGALRPHKIVPLARVVLVLGVNMDPLDVGNRLLPLLSDSGLRLPIVAVLQVSGNY